MGLATLPVVIVHWNAVDACVATVAAFQAQGIPVDLRIVDNASDARELDRLRRRVRDCLIIPLDRNTGFGAGANVGLRSWLDAETGDWIAVAAHDALPDAGCLARLVAAGSADGDRGIVCPEYGDHRLVAFSALRGAVLRRGSRAEGWEPVELPHGTLMLLRRQCLAATGVFDERYFAYGEAEDLGWRAAAAGWQTGIVWGAVVRNPLRVAPAGVAGYLQLRNSINFVREHRGKLAGALRTTVAVVNTPLLYLTGRRHLLAADLRIRCLAIRDGWRGAWGPPPERLTR